MIQIMFSNTAIAKTGPVAVPVFEEQCSAGGVTGLEERVKGGTLRLLQAAKFNGKTDQDVDFFDSEILTNSHLHLSGAGKLAAWDDQRAQSLGGRIAARFLRSGEKALHLIAPDLSDGQQSSAECAVQIAYGAMLRAYAFDQYHTTMAKDKKTSLKKITIYTAQAQRARTQFASLAAIAKGVFLSRDLASEPPNILYPESFAAKCQKLDALGVEVEVLDEKAMKKLGMGALLGVGQGSRRESKLVVMKWMGAAKSRSPVCLVGKGVTFDTGGISLKPGNGMGDMKWDMGGAGAVTGAMAALAGRKAKANVIGILGLVENMPDGNAQRPGDVVTSMSGQTIEILNTDAEGRLVLADALHYAQVTYKPTTIIDLATLTGAILVSLAKEYGGLFSNDDTLSEALLGAGKKVGEELWRMPLGKPYHKMIKSDIADMKNIGGRYGGSSSAAAFLQRFVDEGIAWAHLDIAGMVWQDTDTAICPKGATGYGVRLLDEYVRRHVEPRKK